MVLERGRCLRADTGHTTAHLTMVTDARLSQLVIAAVVVTPRRCRTPGWRRQHDRRIVRALALDAGFCLGGWLSSRARAAGPGAGAIPGC